MNKTRSPLAGRAISRQQALKDLGNPKTWAKDAAKLTLEFHKKPSEKLSPAKVLKKMLDTAKRIREKASGFISPESHSQPTFAKQSRRKLNRRATHRLHKRKSRRKKTR